MPRHSNGAAFTGELTEKAVMRLEEAKRLHPNEWIAFRPLGEGDNPEGRLILHHPDRRTFDKKLIRQGISDVYITFTGPLVREGFSVMFWSRA